ncbi:hypothetical protein B7C51_14905 [Paenibacillus larvae subsp. pulvifaciens]|uniref:Uncharacterized protein n=1 Tax=Paenibacillus larvae subsp. pulvifaciens TaxID=1477 RepID=A0A1V0UUA1_9BACL|nr:hypothetical protein B5S25_13885 [Paenibacillus larvae subsp. pulvifaciens]ARF68803.1 hypothetical protein B7C51_14905 [Paenibacillus larvae subsp. pulvifaciens]
MPEEAAVLADAAPPTASEDTKAAVSAMERSFFILMTFPFRACWWCVFIFLFRRLFYRYKTGKFLEESGKGRFQANYWLQ